MTKIKKKAPAKKKKSYFQRLGLIQKWLLFVAVFLTIFATLPAVIILIIGLLPSITILITDHKNTNKLTIVGCFNLAGVFICIMGILNQFSVREAFFILSDIFNLIIMLGSAGIGLALYCELPNLFIYLTRISAQKRLVNVDEKLDKLAEEWGSEIIAKQANRFGTKKS